ncbi:MAG: hypothetical protein WDA08_11785 [Weeksellaceae bacterium]
MKKLFLSVFAMILGLGAVKAQEGLMAGGHVGFPVGNASEYFGFNIGADVYYYFDIMPDLRLGGMAGLDMYNGKDIPNSGTKIKGLTLMPIALSGQYEVTPEFFAGLDVGIALSLSKDYKGGFLVQPKGGWQNEYFQAFVFFKSISSSHDVAPVFKSFSSITTIGIGGAYKF